MLFRSASAGVGFAIPVKKVKDIIASYKANREIPVRHRKHLTEDKASKAAPQAKAMQESSDPFDEMYRIRQEMDNMLKSLFSKQGSKGLGVFNSNMSFDPNFDIKEKNDMYIVKLDISGMDKDKINIEINNPHANIKRPYCGLVDTSSISHGIFLIVPDALRQRYFQRFLFQPVRDNVLPF